jgi:hypothetical protein
MPLKTELGLDAPDDVYELLVDLHRGLSDEEIRLVDAKLILLLANHVGDRRVIAEAVEKARTRPSGRIPSN